MPTSRQIVLLLAIAMTVAACGTPSAPGGSASTTVVASSGSASPASGAFLYVVEPQGGVPVVYTAGVNGGDRDELIRGAELPRWSPDGTKVSVTAEGPQGLVFAVLMDPDGSGQMPFDSPDPSLNLGCAAWSPDGRRLACEGWDDADPSRAGLYTVSAADGGDLTQVTAAPTGTHDAACDYSPDGTQIAFVRINLEDEAHNSLWTVNVDGSGDRQVTEHPTGMRCDWSPDGTTILTEDDGMLLLVPAEGGEASPIDLGVAGAYAAGATWSPDGQRIAFSMAIHTDEQDTWFDIYAANRDGSDIVQVTDSPSEAEELGAWAP